MARAAVKAKQAARAKAQPPKAARGRRGHASGGNPNQDLFFMRLRRRQKWVFLGLAIVFAATFVGVGVGSGNGGGLSQLYSGLFGGGSGSAISKADAEIKANPKNPVQGYRDLANAYISNNDIPSAILALKTYTEGWKDNAGMWTQLGSLQQQQGVQAAQQFQAAQQAAQLQAPAGTFTPTGPLGKQLGSNPVNQYYAQQGSAQTAQLYQQALSDFSAALTAYQSAAKLQPNNANLQYEISQVAQYSNQPKVALAALQRFVEINPKSPEVGTAEQQCQQLGGVCTPAYLKAQHKKP